MSAREKLAAIAGLLLGIALALVVTDGLLLYASSVDVHQANLLTASHIGIVLTGLAVVGSLLIIIRLRS